jgi:hypothetical protein
MLRALLLAVLAGCASARPLPQTPATPATAPPPSLTAPSFGSPGPIRVHGYPARIRTGGNDPAHHFGFSRDGAELGYCNTDGGLGATWCEVIERDGKLRAFDTRKEAEKNEHEGPHLQAIEQWLKTQGIAAVKERGMDTTGPALTGTWAFAADIELHVRSREAITNASGDVAAQAYLLVGGAVDKHPAVYPFALRIGPTEQQLYGVLPNGVALSPDGSELGFLAAWHGGEFAGAFKMLRVGAGTFAARVYNDTGFALYKKRELAGAADLFLKATFADAAFDLAPYNLACVYALTGDPRAEAALHAAILRGGAKVKEKAREDADFDGVRGATWFRELIRD